MQSSCQGSKGEVWGADRKTPISWRLSQCHNASAPPSFRAGAWAGGHATHTVPAHTVGARYEIPMQLHLFCLQHKSFLGVAEVHLTFSSLRTRLHLEMRWLHASRPLQGNAHAWLLSDSTELIIRPLLTQYIICSLKNCNLHNTLKRVTVKINEQLSGTVHLVLFFI